MDRIAVFGALDREIRSVRQALKDPRKIGSPEVVGWTGTIGKNEVVLAVTGMGAERAAPVTRKVFNRFSLHAVLSIGFACALHPDIRIGDLILSEKVVSVKKKFPYGEPVPADPRLQIEFLCHRLTDLPGKSDGQLNRGGSLGGPLVPSGEVSGIPIYHGPILSVDHILKYSSEKKEIAQKQQVLGADMESAAVGEEAKKNGVPFLSVRAVSDLLTDDLDVDFNRLIDTDGAFRAIQGSLYVLSHPWVLKALNHMQYNTALAARNLSSAVLQYLRCP